MSDLMKMYSYWMDRANEIDPHDEESTAQKRQYEILARRYLDLIEGMM